LNDHLEHNDSSTDDGNDDESSNAKGFGDFYFQPDSSSSRKRSETVSHLSASVPTRTVPKFEVGSCPAVVLNLPSLTPVSNQGAELMKKHAEQNSSSEFETMSPRKSQQSAPQQPDVNTSADDSIFDLEM
jgi:hypothetical protein